MREEQDSAMKERLELHEQMEEYRRLENEKINMIRKENEKYQNDLEQQIEYQRKLKEKEIGEARRELEALNVSFFKIWGDILVHRGNIGGVEGGGGGIFNSYSQHINVFREIPTPRTFVIVILLFIYFVLAC